MSRLTCGYMLMWGQEMPTVTWRATGRHAIARTVTVFPVPAGVNRVVRRVAPRCDDGFREPCFSR